MKVLSIFLPLLLMVFISCGKKKSTTGNNKPTTTTVEDKTTAMLASVEAEDIAFETFYGRGKISYNDGKVSITGGIKLKIQSGEKIWLSANKFGIEGVRALITRDSVRYLNRLERSYLVAPLSLLEETYNIPADYDDVEAFLMGNSIFKENSTLLTSAEDIIIETLFDFNKMKEYISTDSLRIKKIEALDNKERKVTTDFSNFTAEPVGLFSTTRQIKAIDKSKTVNASLDFTKRTWNEDISMPFDVPSSYKRLSY